MVKVGLGSHLSTDYKKIDVYAYAMCLYYIYGEKPWKDLPAEDIENHVMLGERPPLDILNELKGTREEFMVSLIERCWKQQEDERPSFPTIIEELIKK